MAELKTIGGGSFDYTGLISIQGLYKAIMAWLDDHGYGPYETEHSEQVFEDGRQIVMSIEGDKKVSDNAAITWELNLQFMNCQETKVEKEGMTYLMHKGKVVISTDVFIKTNFDKSFEQSGFQYFIRVLMDKFVVKSYLSKAEGQGKKDYAAFQEQIKGFLNMEQFR